MNSTGQPLTLQELPARRKNTELASQVLHQELLGYLDTLRPLLTPERALAKYPGAKLEFAAIEKAYAQFLENYKGITGRAFDAPKDFDSNWVTNINSRLELYRWEYPYELPTARGAKTVTMTSPGRWVLAYPSDYNFSQMRQMLAGRADKKADYMRQFVINGLVLQLAIARTPGLLPLFAALRYQVSCAQPPELNKAPLVIFESSIPSFRPPDDLILAATEFSGVPAFIELIDSDAIDRWEDPLKLKIQEALTAPPG